MAPHPLQHSSTVAASTANPHERLRGEADALMPDLVAWRRDFHAHPELGFSETRTASIVAHHLNDLGLEVSTGIGKTGVVALVEPDDSENTGKDVPTILLRFDMDALPIHEQSDVPYRSQNDGVMHACGHDGHTAIGMGVATLLTRHRDQLQGRVKLVFQPAEEGLGGARAMLEDGVMNNPTPTAAFGMHLWTQLPLNQTVVQAGPLWASAGRFTLEVTGRGGHGAVPQETIDATLVASEIMVAWQSIISRSIAPTDAAVLSVGTFHSGNAVNAISGRAKLDGTLRTFADDVRARVIERMNEIANGICDAYGARCSLNFTLSIPTTINSEEPTALMRKTAERILGNSQVTQIEPMMVGEDMSEFLNRAPGCFILVGASDFNEKVHAPHHNENFDFDERVLPTGVALLTSVAIDYLASQS